MSRPKNSKLRIITLLAVLLGGAYLVLCALWGMCQTAIYIHETIPVTATVTDLRQRPFESTTEALGSGNLSIGGDTAYFPIVSFAFENGARIGKLALNTPDNEAPRIGDPIELRTYPYDPTAPDTQPWRPEGVAPNRASYLWGGDALQLLFGLTIGGIAYLMLRSRRAPRAAKQTAKPKQQPKPAPQKKNPPPPATPAEEEPFTLSAEPAPPKKKRTRKPADPNAPKKPRAPRKKKEADPTAPPKPRKPRKKKTSSAEGA